MVSTFLDFLEKIMYTMYIESQEKARNVNDHFLNKKRKCDINV